MPRTAGILDLSTHVRRCKVTRIAKLKNRGSPHLALVYGDSERCSDRPNGRAKYSRTAELTHGFGGRQKAREDFI